MEKKTRILIVEDSPTQAILLQDFLEKNNFHVYAAIKRLQILDLLFSSYGTAMHQKKKLEQANKKLEKTNKELAKALKDIKTLNGLVPICANCKKIRDDKGFWNEVEIYVQEHSNAEFSH